MLSSEDVGVFVMHNDIVVGYNWRKDFNTSKIIKSDGYLPISGKCSHLHWARVKKDMRGLGLQKLMLTFLIDHAYEQGIVNLYTDVEINNIAALRGINKIGFKKIYRILVLRTKLNWRTITIKY
ncbi:GNAT family N-acetyltransferase [Pelobacter sp. M08fum]|uniref:GNAT family N-acetyltransferase n=2 Tax=Pelovirga terrestris TaxID=2771352 RepID=A0A8J6QNA4_9BACT|nr:GNAT family N-acetyltransferase [Pelovirga terrestris]